MGEEPSTAFSAIEPTRESYWRSAILFGRNVASYKLALGNALLELSKEGHERVTLAELAVPFSRSLTEHLKLSDRQATSSSSKFLDSCRSFNRDEISKDQLVAVTVRLGFNNVIDAFHVVNQAEIPIRFFIDERRSSTRGIRLTDELLALHENPHSIDLPNEVESRWRLVETAWSLALPSHVLSVRYDSLNQLLIVDDGKQRRRDITRCRDALNGYQKGRCFYCQAETLLGQVDVDHFLPHLLSQQGIVPNIDGIWNLVLACSQCNRSEGGKFARLPELRFLEKLHRRNEYLISSYLPLREILMAQTGSTRTERRQFLNKAWNDARAVLIHTWKPRDETGGAF